MARVSVGQRAVAWSMALGGVALSVLADPVIRRELPRHGSYLVLAADFHVHSFPGDGGLTVWDVAAEAERRSLDVIALTNHNTTMPWRLAQMFSPPSSGALVMAGAELTSAHFHMATIGVRSPVAWRQSASAAARDVQAQGGVAIAAHPVPPIDRGLDAAALDAIDGFEAAHPLMHTSEDGNRDLAAFRQRAQSSSRRLAAIGSSDFHFFAPVGICRTFLFVTERSAAGVVDAIRNARTVACDGRGDTYGPPDLAAAVAPECRRVATAPALGSTWFTTVTTSIAWLGFAGLVFVGAGERGLE